jgi:hypothetical protein
MNEPRLLSFKAGRRAIGLAVFTGLTLECTFVRELSSEDRKAKASTRGFVRWGLETFVTDSIMAEEPVTRPGTRAWDLARVIGEEASVLQQGYATLRPANVLAPRDRPRRVPRQELRVLARLLWPTLLSRPCNPVALDAAVLGLYRQSDVLLDI